MSEAFHLFQRYGVELEYMIVDRQSLDVRPLCDRVLHAMTGRYDSDVDVGVLSWSNELVLHVIELKTNGPAPSLDGLAGAFQHDVRRINAMLAEHDAVLLPTAMHPWMDPFRETRLWPHEYSPVYETFHRIFDCRGHGWSNLQSTHVNLPFANDQEFARLHAAIRLVLPLLPALAASSPVVDGRIAAHLDARLEAYRHNARRIPSVSGRVIPEPVFSPAEYQEQILQRIYRDLAPHDPEGIVQYEWANARGAIARFDRDTIEIRVLDIQECPAADLAVVRLIAETIQALTEERWSKLDRQKAWGVDPLADILLRVIREAGQAAIGNADYAAMFGLPLGASCPAMDIWRHVARELDVAATMSPAEAEALEVILREGCLARRIVRALDGGSSREQLHRVYRRLADCLHQGRMFRVED